MTFYTFVLLSLAAFSFAQAAPFYAVCVIAFWYLTRHKATRELD